jgi:hypothetical protein
MRAPIVGAEGGFSAGGRSLSFVAARFKQQYLRGAQFQLWGRLTSTTRVKAVFRWLPLWPINSNSLRERTRLTSLAVKHQRAGPSHVRPRVQGRGEEGCAN